MLKALYSRYRLKPNGGGLRPKVLRLDGWLALMAVSSGWSICFGWQLRCGIQRLLASKTLLGVWPLPLAGGCPLRQAVVDL
jgi:hypothetical protein